LIVWRRAVNLPELRCCNGYDLVELINDNLLMNCIETSNSDIESKTSKPRCEDGINGNENSLSVSAHFDRRDLYRRSVAVAHVNGYSRRVHLAQ